jgi:hypothetical protein
MKLFSVIAMILICFEASDAQGRRVKGQPEPLNAPGYGDNICNACIDSSITFRTDECY